MEVGISILRRRLETRTLRILNPGMLIHKLSFPSGWRLVIKLHTTCLYAHRPLRPYSLSLSDRLLGQATVLFYLSCVLGPVGFLALSCFIRPQYPPPPTP